VDCIDLTHDGTSEGSCEHGDEHTGAIICGVLRTN
jgi:hypothetical protein